MGSRTQTVERLTRLDTLRLLGRHIGLDFANTVDPRHGVHPRDYLGDYADLVAWGRHASLLTEGDVRHLSDEAARRPAEATAIFERAIAVRETIYRVFSARARGVAPRGADLDALHSAYVAALTHARIVPTADGCAWTWREDVDALDRMLWPVVRSAVDLLTADEAARVKECPGSDGCSWLFLDTSKNGSRRWCSMEGCGSRVKMRRHYARHRGEAVTARAHREH